MPVPDKIGKTKLLHSACRHAGARQDLEGMADTSGMPVSRHRTTLRSHGCDVRRAGMPAPDDFKKTAVTTGKTANYETPKFGFTVDTKSQLEFFLKIDHNDDDDDNDDNDDGDTHPA